MVLEAPFEEQITGMAITKLLDTKEQITLTMKIKFIRTFLGYYKIKQGGLQQNVSHIYHFESANKVYDQFNKLINTVRKEERMQSTEKYPWQDDSDERKYYTQIERY